MLRLLATPCRASTHAFARSCLRPTRASTCTSSPSMPTCSRSTSASRSPSCSKKCATKRAQKSTSSSASPTRKSRALIPLKNYLKSKKKIALSKTAASRTNTPRTSSSNPKGNPITLTMLWRAARSTRIRWAFTTIC